MKSRRILSILSISMAALFLVTGCGGEEQQKDTEKTRSARSAEDAKITAITAREAFRVALPKARKWNRDAVLVHVRNMLKCGSDGRSERWILTFDSASERRLLDVHVVSGARILQTMQSRRADHKRKEAIAQGWIDSTQAMERAKKIFVKEPKTYWMGLISYHGTPSWSIKARYEGLEPLWVEIDAKTGEVIKRWKGY